MSIAGDWKYVLRCCVRLSVWCAVVALAVLSLLPPGHIVRTDLGGHIEHALAYFLTASLIGFGYRTNAVIMCVTLVIYAALLEFLQQFVPGRSSRIEDFAYSSAGIFLGLALSWAINKALRHPP